MEKRERTRTKIKTTFRGFKETEEKGKTRN